MLRTEKERLALMSDVEIYNQYRHKRNATSLISRANKLRSQIREELQQDPLIHNNTPFTLEQVRDFKRYGGFLNAWRGRFVDVYAHPTDPTKVVSVGANYQTNTYWICDESYDDYKGRIENGDWSTYR